jgi:hypothetical protein
VTKKKSFVMLTLCFVLCRDKKVLAFNQEPIVNSSYCSVDRFIVVHNFPDCAETV